MFEKVTFVLLGLTLLIGGSLNFSESIVKSLIVRRNKMNGVKTEISKNTFRTAKINGVVLIILGLLIFIYGFI